MIISFFIYDETTDDIVYRTINKENRSKELIINDFKNAEKTNNIVNIPPFTYNYILNNNKYYVIASINSNGDRNHYYNENDSNGLYKTANINVIPNSYIIKSLENIYTTIHNIPINEFYKIIYIVDELINTRNPNTSNLITMESNEEKIYDMMMKNKELERIEAFKEIKAKNKYKEIQKEYGRSETYNENRYVDVKEENIYTDTKKEENILSVEKHQLKSTFNNDSAQPLIINIKEKIKIVTDKEGNVKDGRIEGNLNLIINNKEYEAVEIEIEENDKYKINPNVNKTINKAKGSKNILLKPKKNYPLNRNISLVKWEGVVKEKIVEFVVWMSEIEENKYSLTFEYKANRNLKELIFYFNCEGEIEDKRLEKGKDFIQWKINDYNNDGHIKEEDSVEFITNTVDIYPIEVNFICDSLLSDFKVKSIGSLKDWKEERTMEVDKFYIEE